jgi:hypothetical protein
MPVAELAEAGLLLLRTKKQERAVVEAIRLYKYLKEIYQFIIVINEKATYLYILNEPV